jgi:hypothetical protein
MVWSGSARGRLESFVQRAQPRRENLYSPVHVTHCCRILRSQLIRTGQRRFSASRRRQRLILAVISSAAFRDRRGVIATASAASAARHVSLHVKLILPGIRILVPQIALAAAPDLRSQQHRYGRSASLGHPPASAVPGAVRNSPGYWCGPFFRSVLARMSCIDADSVQRL